MAPAEFKVGQAVRILDGPFTNFVGIVRAVATTPAGLITVGVGWRRRASSRASTIAPAVW